MRLYIWFKTSNVLSRSFFSNILSRTFFRIIFHGFSFKSGYAGPYKNQLMVVLSDGTATQSFFKSNETLIFFLSKEIFAQILFVDFLPKILSSFSLEYSFSDIHSNILSRIFFRIFFRGVSFEYSFVDFLKAIFFRGLFVEYTFANFPSKENPRKKIQVRICIRKSNQNP